MLRRLGLALLLIVLIAVAMTAAGFRIERGGSGWPRFILRSNDDALEADRAQQKSLDSRRSLGTGSSATALAVPASNMTQEAAPIPSTFAPAAQTASVDKPIAPGSTWSDFRGPNRDGRYTATPILTNWPREGLRRLWQQPVGAGYASFVVADGRAFTIEQRRNQEVVAAYDVQTGREIWTNAWNASFEESMGGDGPRATPTYHEGRIYALGAEGELRVLDAAKGALVWRRNILSDNGASNLSWGMSA